MSTNPFPYFCLFSLKNIRIHWVSDIGLYLVKLIPHNGQHILLGQTYMLSEGVSLLNNALRAHEIYEHFGEFHPSHFDHFGNIKQDIFYELLRIFKAKVESK